MEERVQGAGSLAPGKLLAGFSKGHIVFWIAVAVAIHVALIGSLSLGYIRDRWIDPDGAALRKAAAVAAQEALKKEEAAKTALPAKAASATGMVAQAGAPAATGGVAVATATNAAPVASTNEAVSNAVAGAEQIPEDRKNSPMVKRITDKAQPGELPKQPGDIGISLEDTNVH